MSRNDLARMLVVVMSAGEIPRLDMADPRAAHSTLVSLVVDPVGRAVCDRLNAQVATTPDPDVGLRVCGLTQALWTAVELEFLAPTGGSILELTDRARAEGADMLGKFTQAQRHAVVVAGQAWASCSTERKAAESAAASPVGA